MPYHGNVARFPDRFMNEELAGIKNLNFFGSNKSQDPASELMLAEVGAARLGARSLMHRSIENYERAVVADLRGNTGVQHAGGFNTSRDELAEGGSVEYYDGSIETARASRERWKQAELKQSQLITQMSSLPEGANMRTEVLDELGKQKLSNIRSVSDSPVNTDNFDSLAEAATDFLDIDRDEDLGSHREYDVNDETQEILDLFAIDLHLMGEMKQAMDALATTLEDHRDAAEDAKLFEARQASAHLDGTNYQPEQAISMSLSATRMYDTYFEMQADYINSAVQSASGDIPDDHLGVYLDR